LANNQNEYEMVDNRQNSKSNKKWLVWTVSGIIVLGLGAGTFALNQPDKDNGKAAMGQKTENKPVNNKSADKSKKEDKNTTTASKTENNQNNTAAASNENTNTQQTKEKTADVINELKSLSEIAQFDVDSTNLSQPLMNKIEEVLTKLGENHKFTVIGYTDSNGSIAYNLKLSQLRAEAVEKFIKEKNSNVTVSVLAKGESEPIADNSTEDGRTKNRRVEFVLSSN
jgi:outer membrane protein OmpA-like peptidoglycan-associated protein